VPLRPLDAGTVASIRRRADAAERAARAGHLDVLIGYDLRYWRELAEVVANPYLCDFLDRLRVQCWVYAVPCLRNLPDVGRYLWAGHRELLDAVSRDDAEEIGRLTTQHHRHALELADACRNGICDLPGPAGPSFGPPVGPPEGPPAP
jgi:DNA-binding GntR family transcriptional regulator